MDNPALMVTVAVLGGTGKEGKGLASRWAKAGYRVLIGSRNPEKAVTAAAEIIELLDGTGSVVGMSNPEAARQANIVSATSATVLTRLFGDGFHYTDSVEVDYGLAPRNYQSFQQAAVEAGVSRFFGGIHFMDAIDNGREQGLKVGEWVLKKVWK